MPDPSTPLGSTPVTLHVPNVAGIDPSAIAEGLHRVMPLLGDLAAKNWAAAARDTLPLALWAINTFGPKPTPPAPPQP